MSNREMPPAPEADESKDESANVPAVKHEPAKEPVRAIAVIALRDGFYGGQRFKPGQKFQVKKFEDLGLWMKCEDAKIEAKRPKPKVQTVRKINPLAGK